MIEEKKIVSCSSLSSLSSTQYEIYQQQKMLHLDDLAAATQQHVIFDSILCSHEQMQEKNLNGVLHTRFDPWS